MYKILKAHIPHKYVLFICFMIFGNEAVKSNDLGSWSLINIRYNFDNKLSLFSEAQLRSLKYYDHFHYYEYKGGFEYKLKNNFKIALAAGSYQTYAEGGDFILPKRNDEFRLWPQFTLSENIGKFKVEHRYRVELRFTSAGYRNRFRQRLGVSYPLTERILMNVSNELFFTDNEPYFERNRFIIASNFKINKQNTIQVGYINQFDYKINDETGKAFFQIGWYFEIFGNKSNKIINSDIKDY